VESEMKLLRGLAVVVGLSSAAGANAATLNVVGGVLVGASNVNVGGDLYDVQFADGSCIALFSGCDSVSDFSFATQSAALTASQALLDQVFIDGPSGAFDSTPALTAGCSDASQCIVLSPYALSLPNVESGAAANKTVGDLTTALSISTGIDVSTTGFGPIMVYAIWTAVPEPSTTLLLGAGLVLMAGRRRRAAAR
jgi:hypothetical protein